MLTRMVDATRARVRDARASTSPARATFTRRCAIHRSRAVRLAHAAPRGARYDYLDAIYCTHPEARAG